MHEGRVRWSVQCDHPFRTSRSDLRRCAGKFRRRSFGRTNAHQRSDFESFLALQLVIKLPHVRAKFSGVQVHHGVEQLASFVTVHAHSETPDAEARDRRPMHGHTNIQTISAVVREEVHSNNWFGVQRLHWSVRRNRLG